MSEPRPLHECEEVEEIYFTQAPVRATAEVVISAPAERVFAHLANAASWTRWVPGLRSVEWTTPEPRGVGAMRRIGMTGGVVADEYFMAWEADRRMAFRFNRANLPAEAFAEDYRLEALEGGRTRVRWTMCLSPSGWQRRLAFLLSMLMTAGLRLLLPRLKRLVERG